MAMLHLTSSSISLLIYSCVSPLHNSLIKCLHWLCSACFEKKILEQNSMQICIVVSFIFKNDTNSDIWEPTHHLIKLVCNKICHNEIKINY